MVSQAFKGTPCLVPVQLVGADEAERRGFITRLAATAAAVSSDPSLIVGARVVLRFKRPADGTSVDCVGVVTELLPEGGLWRGRPAALVQFDRPAELDDDPPAPEPEEGGEAWGEGPALTDSLHRTGLGRRKLAARPLRPNNPFAPRASAAPGGAPPSEAEIASGAPPAVASGRDLESAFFDEEPTAPPTRRPAHGSRGDDATAPPERRGDRSQPFSELFGGDDATVPPGGQTDPDVRGAFFGPFGDAEDAPPWSLPPGAIGSLGSMPTEEGELPGDAIGPVTAPAAPRPATGSVRPPESTAPAPARPFGLGKLAESGEAPPVQVHARQAAPPASPRPPWEGLDEDRAALSLIPRNARIASTLDVHFWARGHRHRAVADNFSREGLFLTFAGTPPVRGAIVRVEFPLEGENETVPVRFNAEVRWHRSDRPGVGLADGFGVQILTFETPKDRARYGELLAAILALGPAPDPVEAGFSWGKQGGR